MSRHKPPSRIRYEKEHPVVTFRLDRETKQRLRNVLEKKSFASFVKEGLGVREREKKSLENEYKKGHSEGFEEAKSQFAVYTPCTICGKRMLMSGEEDKRMVEKALKDRGYYHISCKEEQEKKRKKIAELFK